MGSVGDSDCVVGMQFESSQAHHAVPCKQRFPGVVQIGRRMGLERSSSAAIKAGDHIKCQSPLSAPGCLNKKNRISRSGSVRPRILFNKRPATVELTGVPRIEAVFRAHVGDDCEVLAASGETNDG